MISPVFADSGYWIALTSGSDRLHERALAVASTVRLRKIVTSEWVLIEYLDGSADRGEHRRRTAAQLVRRLRQDGVVQIVPGSEELFEAALRLYETRPDKEWSLTDCASFVICEREGIAEALTHDRHFVQAGLRALLRDEEL